MIDFVEYFYTEICGYYPFNNDEAKKESQKVIDYLIDCGLTQGEILNVIDNCTNMDKLTFDILPDWLWENSLLEKNTFYYHGLLHILSKPPTWNPISGKSKVDKFHIEMVINFTIDDVLRYFYNTFSIEEDLKDSKRDSGSVRHLLAKYNYDFIKPIDFVLSLIDYAKNANEERRVRNILDISQYESYVYDDLKIMTTEAKASGANQIVWR